MLDTFPPEIPSQRIETKPPELEGFVSEVTLRQTAARTPAPSRLPAPRESATFRRPGTLRFLIAVPVVAALGLAAGMLRAGVDRPGLATERPVSASVAPSQAPVTEVTEIPRPAQQSAPLEAAAPAARVPPPVVPFRFEDRRMAMTAGPTAPASPQAMVAAVPVAPPVALQEIATAARLETHALPAAVVEAEKMPPLPPAAPALTPVPPAAPAVVRGETDRLAVRALLERYRGAYERLDANAAVETWPSVDRRALAKAFADLSSQTLRFDNCDIELAETRGVASCRGLASYVGRVGRRAELAERQWTFMVRKSGDDWRIDSVKTGAAGR